MTYVVQTRDVDGSCSRKYATLAGAVKRFEEMVGCSVDAAIAEHFWQLEQEGKPLPKIEDLRYLRAVSMYGTVVTLEKR